MHGQAQGAANAANHGYQVLLTAYQEVKTYTIVKKMVPIWPELNPCKVWKTELMDLQETSVESTVVKMQRRLLYEAIQNPPSETNPELPGL